MGEYFLNGKNVAEYGITPGKAPDSSLALQGAWDMPSRIGKTQHEWPDEPALEPYLRADEIFFGGRDLIFYGFISGGDRIGAQNKVQALQNDIDAFGGPVLLESDWGTWEVTVTGEVKVNYLRDGFAEVQIPFRQNIVNLTGTLPEPSVVFDYGVDGISFTDLGLIKILTSNQFNRPAMRLADVTAYGYQPAQPGVRDFRRFTIEFAIQEPTYEAFVSKLYTFYALLASPGARTLKLDDGTTREVFVKDGVQVKWLKRNGEQTSALLEVTFSEIRLLETWNILTTLGDVLVDKHGQPLTEIIKKF